MEARQAREEKFQTELEQMRQRDAEAYSTLKVSLENNIQVTCVYVCKYVYDVCMYMYVCICMCGCICMCMCIPPFTSLSLTRIHIHIHIHTHAIAYAYTHTHTYTHNSF